MRRAVALVVGAVLLGGGCESCGGDGLDPAAADLVVEVGSLDFGDVYLADHAERTVGLRNQGTAPVDVVAALPSDAFRLVDEVALELAGGEAVDVTVRFAPLAEGDHAATLSITGAGLSGSVSLPLTGTGLVLPPCDDGNTCTDDRFDPAAGQCRSTFHDRSCDPDNPCVADAQCNNGACVGTFITCPASPSPCRESVCDSKQGCVEQDIPGFCDDGDPCTEDLCGDNGCLHPWAADGTTCGEYVQCESVAICQSGQCNTIPVPDGAPCEDGNVCTTDTCQGGACVGVDTGPGDPTVGTVRVHALHRGLDAAVLPDGRVVVLQAPGGGVPTTELFVLAKSGAPPVWSVQSVQALPPGLTMVVSLGDGRIAVGGNAGLGVFAPAPDGFFDEQWPITPVGAPGQELSGLLMGRADHVFGCALTPNIEVPIVVRVAPDAPPTTLDPAEANWKCGLGVASVALPRMGLVTAAAPSTLTYWDVNDPANITQNEVSTAGAAAPLGWETETAFGVYDSNGLFLLDLASGATTPIEGGLPAGFDIVAAGQGDVLFVWVDGLLYTTESPGPQSTFTALGPARHLEPLGPDLLAIRSDNLVIDAFKSPYTFVDGRIGAVGMLHVADDTLWLHSASRAVQVPVADLAATGDTRWPRIDRFGHTLVRYAQNTSPRVQLVSRSAGAVPRVSTGSLAWHDLESGVVSPASQIEVPPEVPTAPVLTRVFANAQGVIAAFVTEQADPISRVYIVGYSDAPPFNFPAVAMNLPVADVQLATTPDRMGVLVVADEGETGLVLLDVTDAENPVTLGGPLLVSPAEPGAEHQVLVDDHTFVHATPDGPDLRLTRYTFAPGSPTSNVDTLSTILPFGFNLRLLSVSPPYLLVGGLGEVVYFDLATLSEVFSLPVDGHVQDAIGREGKLYVATDRSLTEVFPPCP